ncbi:hypothetical protein OV208_19955 [Corallococcus sp. bb12-1]|uniref:hypothetical protein n=1 Tax=Corallococcus sp. bb12-1 TaxID=2996784 RepID=UPI00226F8AD3|nr:hypothetical protein [Corallococcus sp. bb12-1]MCY1043604.1 hypothetical protein [Corallococcus sp. bb12-1]
MAGRFNIGAKIDSVMERVRQAQAQAEAHAAQMAAAAQSVKQPLSDAPNAKPLNANEGRYLDSFQEERAKKKGLPELAAPQAPGATTPSALPANEAKEAQQEKGWKTSEPTVVQTSKKGCAEATLTFLEQSDGENEAELSQEQAREKVRNRADTLAVSPTGVRDLGVDVNLDDGATPDEMGAILGGMGIEVTSGSSECDPKALSGALKKGEYALALVDSNALLNTTLEPGQQSQEPGELHWITIDAVDPGKTNSKDDDLYRVRDPANGAYWVKASDMKKIVSEAQEKHGSGGIMTVQKEKGRATKAPDELAALARRNLERTAPLGDGNGGASRRASVAESS